MERESQAPSIERPHPFEHRRNLSDRAFSTCPSSCEQAMQLDRGTFEGTLRLDTHVYVGHLLG